MNVKCKQCKKSAFIVERLRDGKFKISCTHCKAVEVILHKNTEEHEQRARTQVSKKCDGCDCVVEGFYGRVRICGRKYTRKTGFFGGTYLQEDWYGR